MRSHHSYPREAGPVVNAPIVRRWADHVVHRSFEDRGQHRPHERWIPCVGWTDVWAFSPAPVDCVVNCVECAIAVVEAIPIAG